MDISVGALTSSLGKTLKVMELQKCLRYGGCRGYGAASLHESSRGRRFIVLGRAQATNAGALHHKGRVWGGDGR
jgi:hypothetical protein